MKILYELHVLNGIPNVSKCLKPKEKPGISTIYQKHCSRGSTPAASTKFDRVKMYGPAWGAFGVLRAACFTAILSAVLNKSKGEEKQVKKEFRVIIEQDEEGYFVAEVPELPGCHTQARSMDELLERTREAISLCLEVYKGRRTKTRLVGVQRIAL